MTFYVTTKSDSSWLIVIASSEASAIKRLLKLQLIKNKEDIVKMVPLKTGQYNQTSFDQILYK